MLKETKYFKEQQRQLSTDVSRNLKMGNWTQEKKITRNVTMDFMGSGFFSSAHYITWECCSYEFYGNSCFHNT